jgi:anaerobic magnesium-protoporphyrin IX monomethyl ester cyclase
MHNGPHKLSFRNMKTRKDVKIVLCTVPLKVGEHRHKGTAPSSPKIAIVNLTKWLEREGFNSEFFDVDMLLPPRDEIYNYFKVRQPDIVGISAVVSTSYQSVKYLSKIIKEASPKTVLVLGGNMAVSANLILRKAGINYCVLGDGEIAFVNLIDYIKEYGTKIDKNKLSQIKGLGFICNDELEFTGYGDSIPDEDMPYPDYKILESGLLGNKQLLQNYFRVGKDQNWFAHDKRALEPERKPNMAIAWAVKGCFARCTFCQRFCKGFHLLDIGKFEEHIIELKEKHNCQFFTLTGENFGFPREFAYNIAKILKKYDFLWISGASRCTNFKPEDYKFFNECGCTGIKFGVESGSQTILNIMEKNFNTEDVFNAIKTATEAGIYCPTAFCIGMPGETNKTIKETGKFLGRICRIKRSPPVLLEIFHAVPLPGAPLYEYGQLQGVIGTALKEEEEYLTYVSDRGSSKENYINLTGQSNRKAIFWEYLLIYEATREFYSKPLPKKDREETTSKAKSNKKSVKDLILKIIRKPGGLKQAFKEPVSSLNGYLGRSKIATKIPKIILYPIMRNMLYLEYLSKLSYKFLATIFTKDEWNKMDFKYKRKKIKYKLKLNESLRKINKKLREQLPGPKTLTEKNQILLYQGR